MLSNPEEQIEKDNDKPFCCKYCGSESYIQYGKENKKQMYKCKECNHKFVDNLYFKNKKSIVLDSSLADSLNTTFEEYLQKQFPDDTKNKDKIKKK